MSSHLSQKRPADAFLNFSINAASILLVFFKELSAALSSTSHDELDIHEAITIYLEQNPDSALASMLDREAQKKKLKVIAEDLLQTFLEPSTKHCKPVFVFLREVLAGVVLESVLTTCSQPGWINDWIVYLLDGDEPELLNAIDVEVGKVSETDLMNGPSVDRRKGDTSSRTSLEKEASGNRQSMEPRQVLGVDEATEEAKREAQRLSKLMVRERAEKDGISDDFAFSASTTEPCATPSSSQSDLMTYCDDDDEEAEARSKYMPLASQMSANGVGAEKPFTEFDQILRPTRDSLHVSDSPMLTLLGAKVTILDDGLQNKNPLRSKPISAEYLLQVEPASTQHPGWITSRKYAQFEALHEYISRIAVISGVRQFPYRNLPTWKHTDADSLRMDLEAYLISALSFAPLAECEAMRRFLERDRGSEKLSTSKGLLGLPTPDAFQNIGKGMLGALANAPKGAAGSGKAIIDGVSGVFSGARKSLPTPLRSSLSTEASAPASRTSILTGRVESEKSGDSRESLDNTTSRPSLPDRPSLSTMARQGANQISPRGAGDGAAPGQDILKHQAVRQEDDSYVLSDLTLEPANAIGDSRAQETETPFLDHEESLDGPRSSVAFSASKEDETSKVESKHGLHSQADTSHGGNDTGAEYKHAPLDTEEARVAIELVFAVVNEMFSLTTVWNVRRTFLNAAKAYILRPGNLGLDAIRKLLQDSIIEANTTDNGIATHLKKLRESALPTEKEMKLWPAPLVEADLERLRAKARKLFQEKALPQALTSIMGSGSSSDALGKVFDSLQGRGNEIPRGLVFTLLLQATRVVVY